MMNEEISPEAASRIGITLAADVTYFAPSSSKNFDPLSIAVGLGGILLGAFLKGVVTELESGVESAGQRVGKWLRQRVDSLFAPKQPRPSEDASDGETAVAAAKAYMNASDSDRHRAIDAARAALERLLLDDYDLPARRATRVSDVVSDEGLKVLTHFSP